MPTFWRLLEDFWPLSGMSVYFFCTFYFSQYSQMATCVADCGRRCWSWNQPVRLWSRSPSPTTSFSPSTPPAQPHTRLSALSLLSSYVSFTETFCITYGVINWSHLFSPVINMRLTIASDQNLITTYAIATRIISVLNLMRFYFFK